MINVRMTNLPRFRFRIRAPANALATSSNWIFNFMVVMITPVAFDTIGYRTYIIFAVM